MCLLGILKHDVVMFNEGLPQLLYNYNRLTLLNACEKTLCQLAISLVVIARKFLTEDEFDCMNSIVLFFLKRVILLGIIANTCFQNRYLSLKYFINIQEY